MSPDLAQDLLQYIDASMTPWHAVAETARRLEAAGFRRLDEQRAWTLQPQDRVYITRAGSSLAAFQIGTHPLPDHGFRLVGAHTDSPNLRLKPKPDYLKSGYRQLGVEVYGGVLWHTWLDRDLSLAGRVVVASPRGPHTHLVDFGRKSLLRIPSLAIHLHRQVNTEGLKLNPQEHLAPVFGLEGGPSELPPLLARLTQSSPHELLAFELCLYDVQPSSRSGANGEFLHAPRLDNLASCHAGLTALLDNTPRRATCGVVLYDHEEVGSRSAQGAASPFLRDCLERLSVSLSCTREEHLRALQQSWVLSADMAHALHPNYSDRHEPRHQPMLGAGPVIKTNVNQSYATDAEGQAFFTSLCREAEVTPQHFVVRTDLPCGSTIGPLTAGELGIRTIDVGNPMLSMHSIREMAAASDVEKMISVLRRFFA